MPQRTAGSSEEPALQQMFPSVELIPIRSSRDPCVSYFIRLNEAANSLSRIAGVSMPWQIQE